MKKLSFLAIAAVAMLASCSDDVTKIYTLTDGDDSTVITFEGDEWDTFIPADQSSSSSELYGDDQYMWLDSTTSGLYGQVNEDTYDIFSYAIWAGGSVVSNYTDSIEDGGSNTQLAVPIGGNNGSNNFLVVYSNDEMTNDGASLYFSYENSISSLYVANTSYMLHEAKSGSYSCDDNVWSTVTFTGYDADDVKTGEVTVPMMTNGVASEKWTKVNLRPLGKVLRVKVLCVSAAKAGTLTLPGYVAIDDITVSNVLTDNE